MLDSIGLQAVTWKTPASNGVCSSQVSQPRDNTPANNNNIIIKSLGSCPSKSDATDQTNSWLLTCTVWTQMFILLTWTHRRRWIVQPAAIENRRVTEGGGGKGRR
jgi:hypothetical protein